MFEGCSVGLSWPAVMLEAAAVAAAAGTRKRWAADRERSEEPAVEPPGEQRTTIFTDR